MIENKIVMEESNDDELKLLHCATKILDAKSKKREWMKNIPAEGLGGDYSYSMEIRTFKNKYMKIVEEKYLPHGYKGKSYTKIYLRRAKDEGFIEKIISTLLPLYDKKAEIINDHEDEKIYTLVEYPPLVDISASINKTLETWPDKRYK